MDFTGRRIVVTGAANGMGLATATRLAEAGGRVALLDRDRAALDRLAGLEGMPRIACEVSDPGQVAAAAARVEAAFGGVDGLVNAAGIFVRGSLEELTVEQWRASFEVNLLGAVLMCRQFAPLLKREEHATIVNVASIGALRPNTGVSAYAAAKAGLVMFSKCMAMELAPAVRVNAVCPGTIETTMIAPLLADPAARQRLSEGNALGRIGAAEEVADAIVYLSGPASSYVNGATLVVDGGRAWL